MKLNDLIDALAAEIELAQPQLEACLPELMLLQADDPALLDALEHYSGHTQRMGEAAEMVGLPGLQAVCRHVLENILLLPTVAVGERDALIAFLTEWPRLIVHHLRHLSDPSTAAGLVDHLVHAPYPMDEEQALKVMHMLGAMPAQVQGPDADAPQRPVLARPDDVELQIPGDADPRLLEGFFAEAPGHARQLVGLAGRIAAGAGDVDALAVAKRLAHTIKGSGAIIGLRGLATLGHHFEDVLEHFERGGAAPVAPAAAEVLLDAADCLEQMVGHVTGQDEAPAQALRVLQDVLDLANRIDRGEAMDEPLSRVHEAAAAQPAVAEAPLPAPEAAPWPEPPTVSEALPLPVSEAPPQPVPPHAASTPAAAAAPALPEAALRVSLQRIEELFRVSGEVTVHGTALESRIKALAERSRELLQHNLRLQKRLYEFESLVDVRALSLMRGRGRRVGDAAFDPLEMDQYSELHSSTHALMEEAADARTLALRLDEDIVQLGGVQTRAQRLARELQHLVLGTRMAEVATLESRLRRNVRSTAQATGKRASLVLQGAGTLMDNDVLTRLAEPLLHLLRNAVDHGLETPAQRLAAGKPAEGCITLDFSRQGQQIVLRIDDDGRGLDLAAIRARALERGLVGPERVLSDDEVARLILLPGFSTRDRVSEISGRGVGLDVVHAWVAAMNGSLRIDTRPGLGCRFELRFAASLSTVQSLVVEAAGERFALPSVQVEQAVPRGVGRFEAVGGRTLYRHGQRLMPAERLAERAGLQAPDTPWDEHDVVIVRLDDRLRALAVDRLLDARELLVKAAGRWARHLRGVAGLSVLGDGGIAVNLDLAQLLSGPQAARQRAAVTATAAEAEHSRPGVLVVDDALSVRNALVQVVRDAGYRAETARDGLEAIERLRSFDARLVLTDLEMPNMNGIELTAHLRGRDDTRTLPVIMITSRSQDKHRRAARQAGVDAYVTKPYNDAELLERIRTSIGAEEAQR